MSQRPCPAAVAMYLTRMRHATEHLAELARALDVHNRIETRHLGRGAQVCSEYLSRVLQSGRYKHNMLLGYEKCGKSCAWYREVA